MCEAYLKTPMNSRPLDKAESVKLSKLSNAGLECSLIYLTGTGLSKSILDAIAPVRELLRQHGVHDYSKQGQGTSNKVFLAGTIFDKTGAAVEIDISLYRPETKKGDPRIWPYDLKLYAQADDVLAIFVSEKRIHLQNLSTDPMHDLDGSSSDLEIFLSSLQLDYDRVANELLAKLRDLAADGPIESVCEGDTAVGRTIETALGIAINSSKNPDYKGIELKAKRARSKTRSNLFAQVPDWSLSEFKSAREMVEHIGYDIEGGIRKLYCTVSTSGANSQGLLIDLDLDRKRLDELQQIDTSRRQVCMWQLDKLHDRLHEKHAETFWIKAKELRKGASKFFELESVKHTRRPSNNQFDRMIGSGEITVDHLIKKTATGKVTEKGPLFKIRGSSLNELFLGAAREYEL